MKPNEHLTPEQIREIIDFVEREAVNRCWGKADVPAIVLGLLQHGLDHVALAMTGERLHQRMKSTQDIDALFVRMEREALAEAPDFHARNLLAGHLLVKDDPEYGVRTATRTPDGAVTTERGFTPGPPSEDDRARKADAPVIRE